MICFCTTENDQGKTEQFGLSLSDHDLLWGGEPIADKHYFLQVAEYKILFGHYYHEHTFDWLWGKILSCSCFFYYYYRHGDTPIPWGHIEHLCICPRVFNYNSGCAFHNNPWLQSYFLPHENNLWQLQEGHINFGHGNISFIHVLYLLH